MENKKGEETKKKTDTDAAKILRATEQKRHDIIESARREANDEAIKILKEVEQKGRQIINDAVKLAKAEADKIVAQAEEKAHHVVEEAKVEKPRTEAEQEGLLIIEAARKKAETEASKIVAQAENKASQIIEEAKSRTQAEAKISRPFHESAVEERSVIEDAKRKAEAEASRIVTEAEHKEHQIIEEARRKAETTANKMIVSAEEKGLQIIDEAKKKAEVEANRIVAQAEEKARQIIEEAKKQGGTKVKSDKSISKTDRRAHQIIEEAEKIAAAQPSEKPQQVVKAATEKATKETKAKGGKQTVPSYKEAELVILPPINFSQLERLRIALQQLTNVRSLTMVGTSDGGTSISIELHRPATIIPDLKKIDAVEEAIEEESFDSHPLGELVKKALPPRTSKGTDEQRILVVLKKTQ